MNVKALDLLPFLLSVVSLLIIIVIFRMCKCTKKDTLENFKEPSTLEDLLKMKKLREKILKIEDFVSIEEIDDIESKTLDILKDIQSVKDRLQSKESKDSFDEESIENELTELIVEEEDSKEDDSKEEDDDIEDDDIEGFVEHSTHSCGLI